MTATGVTGTTGMPALSGGGPGPGAAEETTIDGLIRRFRTPLTIVRLRVQSVALRAAHDYMAHNGVVQLLPVILSPVTDPLNHSVGAARIAYQGADLELTRSMLLHKQAAFAVEGLDRLYVVSPNVRLEPASCRDTGRHLIEFSQVDIEFRGATKDQFIRFAEGLVRHVIGSVRTACADELAQLGRTLEVPEAPFPKHESHELRARHGDRFEERASAEAVCPFWILNLPREFYDREDPVRRGYYHNYDLVWPGGFGEALSGGERDWEHDVLVRKIRERGQDPEAFAPYLALARSGLLVPSAGGGLGVERLVRYLTGAPHIRDVALFPRTPGEPIPL